MLSFQAAFKVYLYTGPCDIRCSFDGLSMLAEDVLRRDPFSGHQLGYCNRRSGRVKILFWDRDEWPICYKRLEIGTFQFPFALRGRKELAAWKLAVLLAGIDLGKIKKRKRYTLPSAMQPEAAEKADREMRTV